jgi:pimeloyl-ACP methyl ester carboxylesterase
MSLINIGQLELETVIHAPAAPDAPAILLIQGLATPLTRWPAALIERLVAAGFRVIAFDNRDVGLSTQMDVLGLPVVRPRMTERLFSPPSPSHSPLSALPPPYTIADMAADAVRLLDALHIESAHIVGASLGGMVAQLIAASYPRRCLSLTSIMSSSGHPLLPPPTPFALRSLFAPLPPQRDEAALVEDSIWRQKVLMSPRYPTSDENLRAMLTAEYRRGGFHSQGIVRQLAALLASGNRRPLLPSICAPTVVLHGTDDPLLNVACGRDTASCISNSEFRQIDGMGHDFPKALAPEFAAAILAAARRAG